MVVNDGDHWSTVAVNDGQWWWTTGQRRRSMTVNGGGPSVNDGQRWRSMMVNGGGPSLTTAEQLPDHQSITGQRWLTTIQPAVMGRVWIGSATWHATWHHVSATCAHVAADVEIRG
ncbi:hypothetical protein Tco_0234919 [Tanacetum coccineum]